MPIRNCGRIWRSRGASAAVPIQRSFPRLFWAMASGINASPQRPAIPTAIRTGRRARCSASSHAASGTTAATAK